MGKIMHLWVGNVHRLSAQGIHVEWTGQNRNSAMVLASLIVLVWRCPLCWDVAAEDAPPPLSGFRASAYCIAERTGKHGRRER